MKKCLTIFILCSNAFAASPSDAVIKSSLESITQSYTSAIEKVGNPSDNFETARIVDLMLEKAYVAREQTPTGYSTLTAEQRIALASTHQGQMLSIIQNLEAVKLALQLNDNAVARSRLERMKQQVDM